MILAAISTSADCVDVDVAVSIEMFDHRHRRFLGDATNQAFAAARDRHIDELVHRQEMSDRRAIGRLPPIARRLAAHRPARHSEPSTSTIAWLLWIASLPPRKITALPLLTQIAAASAVTLGRLS